jgi:hypothetical protein
MNATSKPEMVELEVYCRMCQLRTSFPVRRAGYVAWKDGGLIQKVLSELSKEQRELMISGTCGACFEKLFTGEEEA